MKHIPFSLLLLLAGAAMAHELSSEWVTPAGYHVTGEYARMEREAAENLLPRAAPVFEPVVTPEGTAPPQAGAFASFAPDVKTRWNADFLFIESSGIPAHNMMVGITAWQQQVPLPQRYTGGNAWRIPLHPVPAREPQMVKGRFLRGAIAIAANGIPIFNPQNNRGEISLEIGELDQWGGHCGRADDYHYHVAPVHLQTVVGKGNPLAYALDGYPIYGLTEPDGAVPKELDALHGHSTPAMGYHYHAAEKYPYVIGGFHGEVVERNGQVDPQPKAHPVRESLTPLRGAKITDFKMAGAGGFELTYTLNGEKRSVRYNTGKDGEIQFIFDNGGGQTVTQSYLSEPRSEEPGGETRPPPSLGQDEGKPSGAEPPAGRAVHDSGRKPWIQVHGKELDANGDGAITLDEMTSEARRAFAGYDSDKDGRVSAAERTGPASRSAMGGFVKQHPDKIDADADGFLTEKELTGLAERMFDKEDKDRDGKLEANEWQLNSGPAKSGEETSGDREAGGDEISRAGEAKPANSVSITTDGEYRTIKSNGWPDHAPGIFPRRGNPNTVAPQNYTFRIPLKPKPADAPVRRGGWWWGVALNGVPFEPGTAETWNNDPRSGWRYEAATGFLNLGLDEHNAHVQPNGSYHYHALPAGLVERLGGDGKKMVLVGWAADGFPVYSAWAHGDPNDARSELRRMKSGYRLKQGTRPAQENGPGGSYDGCFTQDFEYVNGGGDLDECNGRSGVTPEFPQGTYYYCITPDFPFVPRMWHGTPDPSFSKGDRPPGGGPGRMAPPGGAPRGILEESPNALPPGADGRPPFAPLMKVLDTNGDHRLDADEIKKAPDTLKVLDKNGDGEITPDEYRQGT